MRHINVSKARAELPNLVDSTERTVITRNGRPVAVLLSMADFRALRAAADLARKPERAAEILRLHEQVQRGDFSGFRRLELGEGERVPVEEAYALRERDEDQPYASPELASSWQVREEGKDELAARLAILEQSVLEQVRQLLAQIQAELAESKDEAVAEAKRAAAATVRALVRRAGVSKRARRPRSG